MKFLEQENTAPFISFSSGYMPQMELSAALHGRAVLMICVHEIKTNFPD
jgi:hypothetical protein